MPSEHTPRCLLSSYDAVQHGFRNYSPHFQSYKNSRSAGPPDFCPKTVILPLVQQKGICGSPDNQAIPKRLDAGPQPHRHRNACSIGKDGRTSTAGWGLGTLTGDLLPAVAHPRPVGDWEPSPGICSLRSHIPTRLAAGFAEEERKKGCASELTHPWQVGDWEHSPGDLLPAVAHPRPPGGGLCRRGKKKRMCE